MVGGGRVGLDNSLLEKNLVLGWSQGSSQAVTWMKVIGSGAAAAAGRPSTSLHKKGPLQDQLEIASDLFALFSFYISIFILIVLKVHI